jgi:hypothetical protein
VTRRLGLLLIWLLCLLAAMIGLAWMVGAILAGSSRAWTLAVSFDQVGNAASGGDEDETISSRAWRNRTDPRWRHIRALVDWAAAQAGDRDHCRQSWQAEQRNAAARYWNQR